MKTTLLLAIVAASCGGSDNVTPADYVPTDAGAKEDAMISAKDMMLVTCLGLAGCATSNAGGSQAVASDSGAGAGVGGVPSQISDASLSHDDSSPPIDTSPPPPSDAGSPADAHASTDGTPPSSTDAQSSKLKVTVDPGAEFKLNPQLLSAALESACEGKAYVDGKPCEVAYVEGDAQLRVSGKCQSKICCPGCSDGITCFLTITTMAMNSSIDDATCGTGGNRCMACVPPQSCKLTTYPGGFTSATCKGN